MDASGTVVGPLLLSASTPSLSQGQAQAASPGRCRFRRAAVAVAHLCGLVLRGKRYIEQSPLVQWAILELQIQMNIRGDLLFNIRDYSKEKVQNKPFERLMHLLRICPNERTPKDILQMQLCLKTSRAFHSLPSNAQQKLCQAFIYQKYIAGTVIMKQGHMATECYLLLSGKLKFMITDEKCEKGIFVSKVLYELEEEDFIGETCLLTNLRRPATVTCESDTELLVIDKKTLFVQQFNWMMDYMERKGNSEVDQDELWNVRKSCNLMYYKCLILRGSNHIKQVFGCALATIRYEQYHATCRFLRKLPLFSTWPSEKIDFIIHCSLQKSYRAGTSVIMDSLDSSFIVIVKSGSCTEAARLDPRTINTQDNATGEITPKCKPEKQGPQVVSLAAQLLKIRTLKQGDVFGLANLMDKSCVLQLSLISEGAECIFIPKRLFLEEATTKSRQMALQMFSSYPTERMIQESYNVQQTWNRYKSKLIKQYLKWHEK